MENFVSPICNLIIDNFSLLSSFLDLVVLSLNTIFFSSESIYIWKRLANILVAFPINSNRMKLFAKLLVSRFRLIYSSFCFSNRYKQLAISLLPSEKFMNDILDINQPLESIFLTVAALILWKASSISTAFRIYLSIFLFKNPSQSLFTRRAPLIWISEESLF